MFFNVNYENVTVVFLASFFQIFV